MNTIETQCPHCGDVVHLPKAMAGGKSNCPNCSRVVDVPGGFDPGLLILIAAGFGGVLLVSGFLCLGMGPVAGFIALGLGAVLVTGWILAS